MSRVLDRNPNQRLRQLRHHQKQIPLLAYFYPEKPRLASCAGRHHEECPTVFLGLLLSF